VTSARRDDLGRQVDLLRAEFDDANAARERALPLCRSVIRQAGSAIRAVHRLEFDRARELIGDVEVALRAAQDAVDPHPEVAHAGFLHDAEKEYAEACFTLVLVQGNPLPSATELGIFRTSWLKGLAEAASELRRHLLDRLRDGDLERGEHLLGAMDDIYDVLVGVDYPDALTGGLRRTVDALRAVLERSRGDVTTTVLQTRLQRAIEARSVETSP
jgi:translin